MVDGPSWCVPEIDLGMGGCNDCAYPTARNVDAVGGGGGGVAERSQAMVSASGSGWAMP